ncbi:MAG: calcium/sodium antiporter [Flavobacteriales bacterium]|nr:calcium/sodium antiporter [Flavobacteriales bacterium]MBK6550747.1 calcium/sodium antiporter [Flavobacteriales bacterium]MBK6883233.1 calcium/sodium antiporter [Flavobacteriales bacterium]MBK7103424.1 calcium/sodium antiporter [Flavobacteriales bacterium]
MIAPALTFIAALAVLLVAARYFTFAAERVGKWMGLSPFVVGVFIVGIGTSLPELISAIMAVRSGASEIVGGNVIGSNVSNLLLITGIAALISRPVIHLGSRYILIDMHYLLGAFFLFAVITHDGEITWIEGLFGVFTYLVYSIYLIKQGGVELKEALSRGKRKVAPFRDLGILVLTAVAIFFGADLTVSSITELATGFEVPASLIALTVLSLGTTLPELAVNIAAIRQGRSEMAVGNVLGSCVFNSLMVPSVASFFGTLHLPDELLTFSLPVMLGAGLFFYLLTNDKHVSQWEGWLFVILYTLFVVQLITG